MLAYAEWIGWLFFPVAIVCWVHALYYRMCMQFYRARWTEYCERRRRRARRSLASMMEQNGVLECDRKRQETEAGRRIYKNLCARLGHPHHRTLDEYD